MSETFNTQSWIAGWSITPINFETSFARPLPAWTGLYDPANTEDASDQADARLLEDRFATGEIRDLTPYSGYRTKRLKTGR